MAVYAIISLFLLLVPNFVNCDFIFDNTSPLTSTCNGSPNTIEPWTGDLVKIKSVNKGSLYTAGTGDDKIYVVHVYGTPYEMGYAHGVLLSSQIKELLPGFMKHVEEELESYVKDLPKKLRDTIADIGLNAALEATYLMTEKYSPKYFFEEMKGLSDGSGVDYDLIVRVHMLPELVKAGCSMLGGWGVSTNGTGLVQLRALDWDVAGPLQNYPAVVVYHPNDGHSFINVGWTGWLTTISGMSSSGIAVSEKHSDVPFGQESRSGIPFNFLMRDILQFDTSLQDSIKRIQTAHRTCSIWLGVGDRDEQLFRLFEYSYSTANVFDDKNVTQINKTRYTQEGCDETCMDNYSMKDLVYWGVHLGCWNNQLQEYYGKLNPLAVIEMLGSVQTGDLQAVVYDLQNSDIYVSNAKSNSETGPANAYDRQFVKLDAKSLFNEPEPVITAAV